jgi:hypothetical protein
MSPFSLKNPARLTERLAVSDAEDLLLVDVPEPLADLLSASARPEGSVSRADSRSLRSVKQRFPAIVLWREDRVGSQAVLDGVVKRLADGGVLWVVIALRKVTGPSTPAAHRLELSDLERAFGKEGLTPDREVRVSAWHVAHRFLKR